MIKYLQQLIDTVLMANPDVLSGYQRMPANKMQITPPLIQQAAKAAGW